MASTAPISAFQLEELTCPSLNLNTTHIHRTWMSGRARRQTSLTI
jgi:hypothetical protein